MSTLAHARRLTASNFTLSRIFLALDLSLTQSPPASRKLKTKTKSFQQQQTYRAEHRLKSVCTGKNAEERIVRFFYAHPRTHGSTPSWYVGLGWSQNSSIFFVCIIIILIYPIEFKIVSVNYFNLKGREIKRERESEKKRLVDVKRHRKKPPQKRHTVNVCCVIGGRYEIK